MTPLSKQAETGWAEGEAVAIALLDELDALRAENARLREALGWFLTDERFVVSVGGNPNVVDGMLSQARTYLENL